MDVEKGLQDDNFLVTHLNLVPSELLRTLRCLTRGEETALQEIITPTTNKKRISAPLAELLTSLSRRVHNNLPDEVKKGLRKIEFVPNNRKLLTCHPCDDCPTSYAPDVVGVAGSRNALRIKDEKTGVISWRAIPYHRAVSDIEVTPRLSGQGDGEGTSQVLSYTWDQLQACPHLPGVYCLDVCSDSYAIGWADASGPVRSPPYLWRNDLWGPQGDGEDADLNGDESGEEYDEEDGNYQRDEDDERVTDDSQMIVHCHGGGAEDEDDVQDEPTGEGLPPGEDLDVNQRYRLSPLLSYLYSLYVPKARHLTRDRTIKPHRQGNSHLDGVTTWDIACGGVVYRDCKLISSRSPWSRRTTIFEHQEDGIRTIIKDYWSDNANRFDELEVLKQVHSRGIMPGVVRAVSSEYVRDIEGRKLTTGREASDEPSRRVRKRTRIRLVFQSVGENLQKVKSLKELLKVFFDLNEAHRAILNETGVLHRDISANNILIRPVHRDIDQNPRYNDAPKFISEVLSASSSKIRGKDTSQCLLIDFDNSAILDGSATVADASTVLAQRTGTPMYIARAISIGHRLGELPEHKTFLRMPELSGEARELYDKAWGEPMYDKYCDTEETRHGAIIPADEELTRRYETGNTEAINHQPRHDVESMFWSLYVTSIQLVPKCDEPDVIKQPFGEAWRALKDHRINDPLFQECDARDMIMVFLPLRIKRMLHPGFLGSPLPKLLTDLVEQIRPEYELIREELPRQDHLHEAMRRLLLNCIVEMEDRPDIEFDTEKKRIPLH